MDKTIRWKQRFTNFAKAYDRLQEAVAITTPNDTERAGLIQFFEVAFELAWKTLKDFLESEGFQVASPREAIKQAFQGGYITHGEEWLEALENRNLTVRTYDEATALKVEAMVRQKYFPLLRDFSKFFSAKRGS